MNNQIIVKITIVRFSVFNSESSQRNDPNKGYTEKPFYNKTPEDCVEWIRKNIWNTAQIHRIVEYDIMEGGIRKIDTDQFKC